MIVLNQRQIDIIKYLKDIEEWVTIKIISQKFDVSERTIRNDLNNINIILKKNNINIEKKPKIGIKMIVKNYQVLEEIINNYNNKIYSCSQRANIIAIILLIKEGSTIEELSNELQVSKSTLVNDLKLAENILLNFDIKLIKEPYKGIKIKENYSKTLNVFLKIYKMLDEGQNKKINSLLYKYSNLDYENIKALIEKIELNKNISYIYEATLEIEIILLFSFCKHFKEETEQIYDEEILDLKYLIETDLDFKLNYEVLKNLTIILNNAKTQYNKNDNIGKEANKITNEIVDEMCQIFSIEKEIYKELINQMKTHFNIAIHRVRNNLSIENHMLEETKYKMPFVFEITNKILKDRKDLIGLEFPEEEVAFIAMYFEILFEKHLIENINTNVLIVCNGGLATSSLLKSRLMIMMPELKIKGTCSTRDIDKYLSYEDIDFIISTVYIKAPNYRVIKVSPLLEMVDCEKIKSAIYNKWYEKNCKYIINKFNKEQNNNIGNLLSDILPENYTQFNKDIEDWRVAIETATKPLINNNKVKKEYVKDMIKVVEKLGNYMVFMPEIAFVHSSPTNVIENSVSYLNLSSKILFGSKNQVEVKTIIVLANKSENKNLIDIVNILEKNNNINKLKNAKSYIDLCNLTY